MKTKKKIENGESSQYKAVKISHAKILHAHSSLPKEKERQNFSIFKE